MHRRFSLLMIFCAFVLLSTGSANAYPITYTLVGVQLSDGGTASGSFVFDPATGLYSAVNITTTTGTARIGATYNYVCGQDVPGCTGVAPSSIQALYLTTTAANQTGLPGLTIFFTGVGATNGLGTGPSFDISNSSLAVGAILEGTCFDAACSAPTPPTRTSVAGFVVALLDFYSIGYSANLNVGDSVVNLSNDGTQGGFYPNTGGAGNLCVNVYAFDPQEEEVACCSCLVTPDGLNSISAKSDLITNTLTPAIPNSIVIKLVSSKPATNSTGVFTVCNPSTVAVPASGLLAWGTTLEPAATAGTYGVVNVPFIKGNLSPSELTALAEVCAFNRSNGTGFGICSSCQTGALSGTKQ
jgi:hypothetical protein